MTAALEWPLQSPGNEPLYLVVAGYVIWTRSKSTAMAISRYELLPDRSIRETAFAVKGASREDRERRPILGRLVLVEEDGQLHKIVSSILRPYGYVIRLVQTAEAREVLRIGFPPLALLVTQNARLLPDVDAETPVLFITAEGESLPPLAAVLRAAVITKPVTYDKVRGQLETLPGFLPSNKPLIAG